MRGIGKSSMWTVGAPSFAPIQYVDADGNHVQEDEEGSDFHKFNCLVLRILK